MYGSSQLVSCCYHQPQAAARWAQQSTVSDTVQQSRSAAAPCSAPMLGALFAQCHWLYEVHSMPEASTSCREVASSLVSSLQVAESGL